MGERKELLSNDFERDLDGDFECDFLLFLSVRDERDRLRSSRSFLSWLRLRGLFFCRSLAFSSTGRWVSLLIGGVCDLLRDFFGETDFDQERLLCRELLRERFDQPDDDERERRRVETNFFDLPCDLDRDRPKS